MVMTPEKQERLARRHERRRRHVEQLREKQHDELIDRRLDRWDREVPSRNKGVPISELEENRWDGHISAIQAKKLLKWSENPSGFLVLLGGEGVGKSTLAASLVQVYLEEHLVTYFPVFESMPILLNEFSFNQEDDPISRVSSADIAVLDDVGAAAEGMTPHQKKCLWSVISERWSRERPTIITTNMSLTGNEEGFGMQEWFGESAWARIMDDSLVIEMTGESFRGRR